MKWRKSLQSEILNSKKYERINISLEKLHQENLEFMENLFELISFEDIGPFLIAFHKQISLQIFTLILIYKHDFSSKSKMYIFVLSNNDYDNFSNEIFFFSFLYFYFMLSNNPKKG